MSDPSLLPGTLNLEFVEGLYSEFLRDPSAVSEDWGDFFREWENGDGARVQLGTTFRPESVFHGANGSASAPVPPVTDSTAFSLQDRVDQLIRAYRVRGHMIAQV